MLARGGEMNQAFYAPINNKRKRKKKDFHVFFLISFTFGCSDSSDTQVRG
jgi:hypothetical protein